MAQILKTANSFPLWIIAAFVIGVVIFQAIIFIKLASRTAASVGMTGQDIKSAIRTGAISSLGPSFAIIIVAISLLTLIGNPVTLIRIGIIGSAAIETVGATLGAEAAGADLGSANFTEKAFANAVWVMCLGGMGWLLSAALFTKSLGKMESKIASKGNESVALLKTVSTAAMIGTFGYLGSSQMVQGLTESTVLFAAFLMMLIIIWTSNKFKLKWLREWSLGFVIVVGITVGYFIS